MVTLIQNTKPKVSVICVCYNHVEYIERTINGFLSQNTTFPYEIIIGDDCSTDGTIEIIKNYSKINKDKIKPILRRQNIGGFNNLNDCLEKAIGEYIAYCEGDDYWNDNMKLQKQYNLLEANLDSGLVWTDVDLNDLHENKIIKSVFKNKFLPTYNKFEEILINKPFFAPSTWFFRRKYADFFSKYSNYVDGTFPFILDIIKSTNILFLNDVTGVYTKRLVSSSNDINPIRRYQFAKSVYKIQMDYTVKYNVSDEIIDIINFNYYKTLLHYAIIAEDENFLFAANKKLSNCKDKNISALLLISRNNYLRLIFKFVYGNKFLIKIIKKFQIK